MILPDPNQTDIPIEVHPQFSPPTHPYFRQLAAIISVFVLTAGLGLAVKLAQQRQDTNSKAGGAIVANVLVGQHMISKNWDGVIRYSDSRLDTNGKGIGLSVQPTDLLGSNILYDPGIQWGMSSTNSVGDLNIHSSNRYAEFIPNGNEGIADIWVRIPNGEGSIIEKGVLAYVKGPYNPQRPQPSPTSTPIPWPSPSSSPSGTLSQCNDKCGTNSDCPNSTACINGSCRNPICSSNTDCNCNNPVPVPGTIQLKANVYCGSSGSNDTLGLTWTTLPGATHYYMDACVGKYCTNFTQIGDTTPYDGTFQSWSTGGIWTARGINNTFQVRADTPNSNSPFYSSVSVAMNNCTNPLPSPTPRPINCGWCGQTCMDTNSPTFISCPGIPAPLGKSCVNQNSQCVEISDVLLNHAPAIYTSYLPSANLDTNYNTAIEAYDDDGDILTMTATTLPDGIRLTECNQTNYPNTHLTCHLTGKTNSTIANSWSVKIEVKDSKGTITTKYLDLYVSPPQPTWVNWYNDSIKISGNIIITIDDKKYKNMNLGASTITDNSIDIYWYENDFSNSVSIKFDHDDQYWWISNFEGKVGSKKISQTGQFYKTLLGRSFTIQNWELPNVRFGYFDVQAFANFEYQPQFITEQLPSGRLFGWYTTAISVEDQNINDWNSMKIENLPPGLKLGTCATENRSYPPTEEDKNILHCLITGRPAAIGDHTITAKIFDKNNNYVTEKNYILPVNLLSVTPPAPAKVIVSHTEYTTNFVVGRTSTLLVEVTNIGGSDAPRVSPTISAGSAEIKPHLQDTCRSYSLLKSGERCFLAYDITFFSPGDQTVIIGNLISMLLPVAPREFIPLPILVKSNRIYDDGDVVNGYITLYETNKLVFESEVQFVYSVSKRNFVAKVDVPAQLSGLDLNMVIKLQGELSRRFPNPIVLSTEVETPIDATNLPLPINDFNNDNRFDISDVGLVLSKYTSLSTPVGSNNQNYDINGDGVINISDIALVLAKYTKLTTNGD